jgi:hypothetical protein
MLSLDVAFITGHDERLRMYSLTSSSSRNRFEMPLRTRPQTPGLSPETLKLRELATAWIPVRARVVNHRPRLRVKHPLLGLFVVFRRVVLNHQ